MVVVVVDVVDVVVDVAVAVVVGSTIRTMTYTLSPSQLTNVGTVVVAVVVVVEVVDGDEVADESSSTRADSSSVAGSHNEIDVLLFDVTACVDRVQVGNDDDDDDDDDVVGAAGAAASPSFNQTQRSQCNRFALAPLSSELPPINSTTSLATAFVRHKTKPNLQNKKRNIVVVI